MGEDTNVYAKSVLRRGAALAAVVAFGVASTAVAADYNSVTDERLRNPEPHNWLSWRGNDEGWGYSPLDQITTGNVANLVPVWTYSTGVNEGHQAPPIVNDGMMFVSTPQNQVIALDAKTGKEIWRYVRALPEGLFQLHPTNRGVALYEDMVYMATVDACLVGLDAKTGEQAWENCIGDWKNGEYSTLAPLVAKGKVLSGVSGGEYGIRGFITAWMPRPARPRGRPSRCRVRARRAMTPGRAIPGRRAAPRSG